jgi:hypothetical protein
MEKTNIVGKKFNRLTTLEYTENRNGQIYQEFLCDCGVKKIINKGTMYFKTPR